MMRIEQARLVRVGLRGKEVCRTARAKKTQKTPLISRSYRLFFQGFMDWKLERETRLSFPCYLFAYITFFGNPGCWMY